MSQKKIRRESLALAPSKGTSTSRVEPESAHADSEEDEDSEILLHPKWRQTRGHVVVTVEDLSKETIESVIPRSRNTYLVAYSDFSIVFFRFVSCIYFCSMNSLYDCVVLDLELWSRSQP